MLIISRGGVSTYADAIGSGACGYMVLVLISTRRGSVLTQMGCFAADALVLLLVQHKCNKFTAIGSDGAENALLLLMILYWCCSNVYIAVCCRCCW
jgi:hypothetical protein